MRAHSYRRRRTSNLNWARRGQVSGHRGFSTGGHAARGTNEDADAVHDLFVNIEVKLFLVVHRRRQVGQNGR